MPIVKSVDNERNTVRVLAIEDNPGDLRLVREYLGDASLGRYAIESAQTLSSAEGMLDKSVFDIILLDLNLPDSTGLETFDHLHLKYPKVPIIILTGSKNETTAAQAIITGAQDYLFKDDLTSSSLSHAIIYATERKRIERKLLEEKGRAELYLDLLTHDINNYITAALGYLQLAEARLKLDEKDKKLIDVPIRELRNMSDLIATVRNIQRLERDRDRGELVDICVMLEEVVKDYEHPPGREAKITLRKETCCSLRISSILKDAFTNMVSNSIKHSTGPLIVDITMTEEIREGVELCRVAVEDNGPGIPDDLKTKVFDRSTRGSTKVAGHGLGLYLVKRLVEDQGGKVWVEDRVPGDRTKGARFVVLLPSGV